MSSQLQILFPSKDLFGPLGSPRGGEQKGGPRHSNVMDFFDVRKLTANFVRDTANGVENKYREEDYSVVALFPIVMIGAVLFVICGAYRIKRWKLEKKQLAHLSLFYDIFEDTKCEHNSSGKHLHGEGCSKLRSVLMIPPPRSTPFFQPPPAKGKKPRVEVPVHNASAVDIGYHLSQLLDTPQVPTQASAAARLTHV